MPLESTFNFIEDLNEVWPNNSPDQVKESANHHRGVKNAVKGSFPNLGQASVTLTAPQVNQLLPDVSQLQTDVLAIPAKIEADSYATSTVGGTVKARVSGTDLYLTINGTNA